MVEAEACAAFGDGDWRGRRVGRDVVQMANYDLTEVGARGLEDIDLLERAPCTSIGGVRDDRKARPGVGLRGRLERLPLFGIHRNGGSRAHLANDAPSLRLRTGDKVGRDLIRGLPEHIR